ncbi:MAG TPA: YopX family protein [Anaerovoracaceae bacterium]|nr:YopX family protein [Anaerovoracaceae bacterium]
MQKHLLQAKVSSGVAEGVWPKKKKGEDGEMSRILKFRAWDKERKVIHIIFDSTNQTEWYLPHWKDNFEVMQYTSLNDKNGKEIYEGDVVKTKRVEIVPSNYKTDCEVISKSKKWKTLCWYENHYIKWNCDEIALKFKKIKDNSESFMIGCEHEVIGNVYENPELLKEEKQC